MINTKRFLKLGGVLVFAIAVIFTACKKQEIQGPKGEAGDPGIGGNSNIVSTNTFIITSSQWVNDTVANLLKVSISFTNLTQDVVDKGGVKVYTQSGTAWSELPFVTGDLFTQYGFEVGYLYLHYINIEGAPVTAPPNARYRMVILSEVQKTPYTNNNNGYNAGIKKIETNLN